MNAPALADIKLTPDTAQQFAPSWAYVEFKTARPLNEGEKINDKNLKELLPTPETLQAVRGALIQHGITLVESRKDLTYSVAGPKAAMDQVFAKGIPDSLKQYLTDKYEPFVSSRVVPGTLQVVFPVDWKQPK